MHRNSNKKEFFKTFIICEINSYKQGADAEKSELRWRRILGADSCSVFNHIPSNYLGKAEKQSTDQKCLEEADGHYCVKWERSLRINHANNSLL